MVYHISHITMWSMSGLTWKYGTIIVTVDYVKNEIMQFIDAVLN